MPKMMSPFSLSTLSPPVPLTAIPCSFFSRQFHNRSSFLKIEALASLSASYSSPKVVVTRDRGKNAQLINALVIPFFFFFFSFGGNVYANPVAFCVDCLYFFFGILILDTGCVVCFYWNDMLLWFVKHWFPRRDDVRVCYIIV